MIVILDNLRSAHNVGSIIRTAEGLGITKIFLAGITPGAQNKGVLKTALGAEKTVELSEFPNILEAIKQAQNEGYLIYSLEISKEAQPINKSKLPQNIALVVGNEVSGVSQEALSISEEVLMIPLKGKKESLNVAIAFGIAAFILSQNTL